MLRTQYIFETAFKNFQKNVQAKRHVLSKLVALNNETQESVNRFHKKVNNAK